MACRKMNEDVTYARNTESGCKISLERKILSDETGVNFSKKFWKLFL